MHILCASFLKYLLCCESLLGIKKALLVANIGSDQHFWLRSHVLQVLKKWHICFSLRICALLRSQHNILPIGVRPIMNASSAKNEKCGLYKTFRTWYPESAETVRDHNRTQKWLLHHRQACFIQRYICVFYVRRFSNIFYIVRVYWMKTGLLVANMGSNQHYGLRRTSPTSFEKMAFCFLSSYNCATSVPAQYPPHWGASDDERIVCDVRMKTVVCIKLSEHDILSPKRQSETTIAHRSDCFITGSLVLNKEIYAYFMCLVSQISTILCESFGDENGYSGRKCRL